MNDSQVELRRYAEKAYEKDLAATMTRLHDSFAQWQQGDVSVWQLETRLTEFVNGSCRALHTTYMLTDPVFAVAYAVRKGILALEEIPAPLHEEFSHLMNTIKV